MKLTYNNRKVDRSPEEIKILAADLIQEIANAVETDREAFSKRQPAIEKLKLLPKVRFMTY